MKEMTLTQVFRKVITHNLFIKSKDEVQIIQVEKKNIALKAKITKEEEASREESDNEDSDDESDEELITLVKRLKKLMSKKKKLRGRKTIEDKREMEKN